MNLRRALSRPDAWALAVGLAVAAWFLGTRWLAVFSEAINWDEFALLARADRSLRLGTVEGGGRPGLVTIVLMPFVKGCVDSVVAVVNARLAWQFVTLAYLAGVHAAVRSWIIYSRDRLEGRGEAILAVALLAFLPAFVTWSVQVRTDQVALAAGIWGCVLLMARRQWPSIVAGGLFGIAILSTQKALYVIAFGGVLFLTASISRALASPGALRGEVAAASARALLAAAGMTVVIGGYYLLVPSVANLVSPSSLTSSAATMDWYGERLGFRAYTVHASRLWVHWLLFAYLVGWTWGVLQQRNRDAAIRAATCWSVLVLGLAVAVVHGSRFPYFLMTAGLFPAVALALAVGPALSSTGVRSRFVIAGLLFLLATASAPEAFEIARGSQERQRTTMSLIDRTGLRELRGFQVEGALFCARDPDPLPPMFTQQILRRAELGPHAFDAFVEEFRRRPISYIVESYRMSQFPNAVTEFWRNHYVPSSGSLLVAGIRIYSGPKYSSHTVIVPGEYAWRPRDRSSEQTIEVSGSLLVPGDTVWLDPGVHTVVRSSSEVVGTLSLAIDGVSPAKFSAFYDPKQVSRLRGLR